MNGLVASDICLKADYLSLGIKIKHLFLKHRQKIHNKQPNYLLMKKY